MMILLFAAAVFSGATPVSQYEPNIFSQFDEPPTLSGKLLSDAQIPAPYLGRWNTDLSKCSISTSEGALEITPDKLVFPGTDAEVSQVRKNNSRTITIKASFVRDNDSWDAYEQLILSRSGDRLTTGKGRLLHTRYRCPSR